MNSLKFSLALVAIPRSVENHDYAAVTKDRGSGEHLDIFQISGQRLDHDFLTIEQFVHDDAEQVLSVFQYQNIAVAVPAFPPIVRVSAVRGIS